MKGITLIALPVNTGICIFQIPKGTQLEEMDAIYNRIRSDFKNLLEVQPTDASVANYDENDCKGMLAIAEPIQLLTSICQTIGDPAFTPDWSNKFLIAHFSGDEKVNKLLQLLRRNVDAETSNYLSRHGISWLIHMAGTIPVRV